MHKAKAYSAASATSPLASSGLGRSERDIAKLCPGAMLAKGLAIHGARVIAAKEDVENWLNTIGVSQK